MPTLRDELVWLQPFPDQFLEGAVDRPLGPEARYERARDGVSDLPVDSVSDQLSGGDHG